MMGASLPMLKAMKAKIAVRWHEEGHLLKTVRRKRIKNPKKVNELVSVGVQGKRGAKKDADGRSFLSPYWLEFGTVKIAADPIIRPVFLSHRKSAVKIFRTKLAGSIARIAKKVGNENARKMAAKVKRLR